MSEKNICPICNKVSSPNSSNLISLFSGVKYLKCEHCKSYFLYTIDSDFANYDLSYNLFFHRVGDMQKASVMASRLSQILTFIGRDSKFLEIGVGNGLTTFLLKFLGHDAIGTELDTSLVSSLNSFFPSLFYRFDILSKFQPFADLFDVIYSSDVIEHFNDPYIYFDKVFSMLKVGGYFVINTPCADYIEDAHYKHFNTRNIGEHRFIFSTDGLKFLASKYNFSITEILREDTFKTFFCVLKKN